MKLSILFGRAQGVCSWWSSLGRIHLGYAKIPVVGTNDKPEVNPGRCFVKVKKIKKKLTSRSPFLSLKIQMSEFASEG